MQDFWSHLPPPWNILAGLVVGFGVSLGAGGLIVPCFNCCMKSQLPPEPKLDQRVSPHITGLIERLVFTSLVIVQPEGAPVAMGAWLALKMAANWNKDIPPEDPSKARWEKMVWNSHAFLGLLTGFLSMAFAGLGGWIARLIMGLVGS